MSNNSISRGQICQTAAAHHTIICRRCMSQVHFQIEFRLTQYADDNTLFFKNAPSAEAAMNI